MNRPMTIDGAGIQSQHDSTQAGHFGLLGMRERAGQIGATLQIESQAAQGTTIRVCLPLVVESVAKLVKVTADRGEN